MDLWVLGTIILIIGYLVYSYSPYVGIEYRPYEGIGKIILMTGIWIKLWVLICLHHKIIIYT